MTACAGVMTLAAPARAEPLAATLVAQGPPIQPTRSWSFQDIIEVTRIDGTAVDDAGGQAAFILKQPSVETDDVRYGLYLVPLAATSATGFSSMRSTPRAAGGPSSCVPRSASAGRTASFPAVTNPCARPAWCHTV
jgi:hypothetical protein